MLAVLLTLAALAPQEAPRPNVLFLLSDDQRADSIAAFARSGSGGVSEVDTPNLDRLAARGTIFDRAYCQGSPHGAVCMPSRATMLSGRSLFNVTITDPPEPLLPELLREAGYSAFATGKWHNGKRSFARAFPHDVASVFFGGMGSHTELLVHDHDPSGAYPNDARRPLRAFSSTEFADAAIDFLDRHARSDGGPFIAYVAFTAPHDPRTPPEEYRERYPADDEPLPPNFLAEHPFDNGEMDVRDERLAAWPRDPMEVREHLAEYHAMITQLDAQVGRILDALERTGQAENTVVVFASDHGLAVGSHGLIGKQSVYEHSMRAPLIVAGPGVRAGGRSDALVYLHDLYPTLLAWCGVDVPDHAEGVDLGAELRGETAQRRDGLVLAYERHQRAIVEERWKLIRYPRANRTQLFDLALDPAETNDLSRDPAHAALVERLSRKLAAELAAAGDDVDLFPEPRRDYAPTWDSLAEHPTPAWFEQAKLGIFVHWGVYSVPAYCDPSTYSEWYRRWVDTNAHDGAERRFHDANFGADFAYEDFAPDFRAELFDPAEWASLFRRAGAGYVVLTSKHHDGYALWPSAEASAARGHAWNAAEVGPERDLVGDLTAAVRAEGLRMGLYYSFLEWHNPVFDRSVDDYVEQVMFPQVKDLIRRYQPDVFWPDGEWELPDATWRSPELLAWIYANAQNAADLAVNDRWGKGLRGSVGDYFTTEYGSGGANATSGARPWEECRGIGRSFAFNRAEGYAAYLERDGVVRELVDVVSRGGSLLLDVGPTADGRIPLLMQDRLLFLGRWLEVNGEAIYGASRSPFKTQASTPWGRATVKGNTLYLHVFDWPADDRLVLADLRATVKRARVLGSTRSTQVPFEVRSEADDGGGGGVAIDLSGEHPLPGATVVALSLAGPPRARDDLAPLADGACVLHVERAELFGGGQRLEPSRAGARPDDVPREALSPDTNVGFWTQAPSGARWRFDAEPGRRYAVELVLGIASGEEGSAARIAWGDASLPVPLDAPTGTWHDYAKIDAGELVAPRRGAPLVFRVDAIAGTAALNLKAIVLRPR